MTIPVTGQEPQAIAMPVAEAVTPAFVPLGPEVKQSPGMFRWIANGAASLAGGLIGGIVQVPFELLMPNIQPLLEALDKKTKNIGFSEMIPRFAAGLFEFICEKAPGNFLKGFVAGGEAKGRKLTEALICHALTEVTKTSDSPHVIKTAIDAIFQSVTDFLEKPHPGMKENYERYKCGRTDKEKRDSHEFLCQEITPLVDSITKKLGLDETGLKALNRYLASYASKYLRSFLIDQIIEFYGQTVLGASLSTEESVLLRNMKGGEDLELVAKASAELITPQIFKLLAEKSDLITTKIDKVVTKASLLVSDEAILNQELQAILDDQSPNREKMAKLLEDLTARFLNKGLVRLALASPLKEGDAKVRLEAYFKQILAAQKFDPLLAEKIKEFKQQTAELIKAEKALTALRKEALTKPLPLSKAFYARFDKARDHVDELKTKVNSHSEEELHACFRPLVSRVLGDMRYHKASDLPVPEACQEAIWEDVLMSALPALLVEQYALLQPGLDDIFQDIQKRPEYVRNLESRGDGQLASYARSFARYIKKFVNSFVPLNAAEWTKLAADKLGEKGYLGPESKKAVQELFEKRGDAITDWIEDNAGQVSDAVERRAGQLIEDGIEAFIVRMFDVLTANIRKMEEKDPMLLFRFTLEVFRGLNKHIELINRVTREQGKKYMYEVDPLVLLREFERARLLDPAMPGYELQCEISCTEQNIEALEQQIEEKSVELGQANIALKEEKAKLTSLREKADKVMKSGFFDDFMLYLLSFSGIKGPQDLPGPKQCREEMWNLLTKSVGGDILLEVARAALEPDKLNKALAVALEQVNETLTSQAGSEPQVQALSKDDQDMVEVFVTFLNHARETLPGTWIGVLAKIDELRQLPGPSLAKAMREIMKNYSLEKLFIFGISKASETVSDMLLEPLPKNREQLEDHLIRKEEEGKRTIEKFHREAGATTGNLWDSLANRIVAKWNSFQASFDLKVEANFGWIGKSIKQGLDYVCRIIFIDVIVRPLYLAACVPFWVFNYFYSRRVIYHAEHLRRNIVETSIHQNFGFWAMRLMKQHFRVSSR